MLLLTIFAFVAGAATALSPCVLPVLPIALSAGATGGRRRPLGIIVGLVTSFTFATVALVYLIAALGLPDSLLRNVAIAVLAGFGLVLLLPPLAHRVEARISRVTSRAGMVRGGDGFGSGILVGLSLGLVYAPCAGPILAGVITVTASQPFTAGRLVVALAYALGSAMVLYAAMLGGRRLIAPLAKRSGKLQVAMGAIMVLMAAAMFGEYDIRFQTALANNVPAAIVNPSGALEQAGFAEDALADLRGADPDGIGARAAGAPTPVAEIRADGESRLTLPVLGRAPEIVPGGEFFNTGGEPLSLESLRGRVVLLDFWTYSCINCIRTFPHLREWHERYADKGLTIIGVHSPEFPFERSADNVERAIRDNELPYPVVQDNQFATWNAYGNRFWPAGYFIDAEGQVRFAHFGEGEYDEQEEVIRTLLAEAGEADLGDVSTASGEVIADGVQTRESYLGSLRAERFVNGDIGSGDQDFGDPPAPPANHLAFGGNWSITGDSATAGAGARLDLRYVSKRVFIVLSADRYPARVRVMLDGEPIPAAVAGPDVKDGVVTVTEERLYDLVAQDGVEEHLITLMPEEGVTGYAFSFG
ncbi:MAG: cytochrome c biogenesis protein DipZ [Miltoncostaeaceae bacterium]